MLYIKANTTGGNKMKTDREYYNNRKDAEERGQQLLNSKEITGYYIIFRYDIFTLYFYL